MSFCRLVERTKGVELSRERYYYRRSKNARDTGYSALKTIHFLQCRNVSHLFHFMWKIVY